jgi:hypothetical protein
MTTFAYDYFTHKRWLTPFRGSAQHCSMQTARSLSSLVAVGVAPLKVGQALPSPLTSGPVQGRGPCVEGLEP